MASHRNLDKDYTKRTQDYNSYTLSPSKSKSKPKHLQKTKLNLSPINRTPKQTRELKMNFGNLNSVTKNYGNININVNNIIINNNRVPLGFTPINNIGYNNGNNYNLYLKGGSMLSKIGYDIIGKSNKGLNNKGNNVNSPKKKYPIKASSSNKSLNNEKGTDNVMDNLVEDTQENNNTLKETFSGKQIINSDDSNALKFNPTLWECLFDLELTCDQKQSFSMIIHRFINLLSSQLPKREIPLNLFTIPQLNLGYSKLMKISFIFVTYLKYILLDFIYEVSLKSIIKKIFISYNTYLIQIIEHYIYQKSDSIIFDEDFISKYKKLCKAHKNKRNQGIPNPTTYGTNLHKNIETVIINIKQMSNNFFKIGYLNPVHNICFEFFKLIDSYTPYTLANLIINHVLFFVIHNNPKEKNNKTITNNNIVFNPTSLLSLYGFNTGNVQGPFLPPDDPQKYTLVLDLDETLVHFFYTPSGGSFLIRPHCFDFLEEMSSIFDIAIFTAGMKDYADSILDLLDPEKKWIKYRLYRHHTSLSGMCFVKDLSKLGRDLKKVIIIDNLADNFRLQPNNGLEIKTWTEEMRDSQLKDIGHLLNEIIKQSPSDIRITLKKVKEEYIKRIRKNQMNPYKNISIV